MFVASSLYNYARGSSSTPAAGEQQGESSSSPNGMDPKKARVKRHPRKRGSSAKNGSPLVDGGGAGGGLEDAEEQQMPQTAEMRAKEEARRHKVAIIDEILLQDDLYKLLDVSRKAKTDEIRRGFLKRSRLCHPDKFPDYPASTMAFQKISFAYETLSKPSSRRIYDVSGRTDFAASMNHAAAAADGGGMAGSPGGGPGGGLGGDDTLNGVLYSVFCEFMEGDFEMVKVLFNALNDSHPGLDLGADAVDNVEGLLRKLRTVVLSGKKYLSIIRFELIRLYEIQHSLRQLSYFDVFGRLRLTLQLARVTLSIPMAIDQAMMTDGSEEGEAGVQANGDTAGANEGEMTGVHGNGTVIASELDTSGGDSTSDSSSSASESDSDGEESGSSGDKRKGEPSGTPLSSGNGTRGHATHKRSGRHSHAQHRRHRHRKHGVRHSASAATDFGMAEEDDADEDGERSDVEARRPNSAKAKQARREARHARRARKALRREKRKAEKRAHLEDGKRRRGGRRRNDGNNHDDDNDDNDSEKEEFHTGDENGTRTPERRSRRKANGSGASSSTSGTPDSKKMGLLGPTSRGLLKGVVTLLETSEGWVPGGGKKQDHDD